ncbi:BTB/POZ and MATH domain-containing protein 2 [Triticum aestivum]|uniref:BTB/POZ and MATH domain-containing protein 2 n=1 Tax=Triticum aestivum TaxID=4565 RepID=UPI001D0022D8|nr:BTB/POZ and MATH domain-containing protein 2-like [Triticum aestivum]
MAHNAAAAVDHGEGIRTSSRCVTEGATHDFEVTNYPLLEGMGVGTYISSSTFTVGGYDWNVRFYPNGDRKDAAGHASAFLCYLSPVKDMVMTSFTLSMLDDQGNVQATAQLSGRLHHALKDGKGADVTLLVGGTEFSAHRFMLAAQSPVFDTQLFGTMMDKNTSCMEIVDMEPAIFEMLLHCVYTDSLQSCSDGDYDAATLQHLLVAAVRYGLDRLKVMFEGRLCKSIDEDTIMSTLALANQHSCERLKNACLEFLLSLREAIVAVMNTDGH